MEETSKDLLVSRILEHTIRCGVCAVRLGKDSWNSSKIKAGGPFLYFFFFGEQAKKLEHSEYQRIARTECDISKCLFPLNIFQGNNLLFLLSLLQRVLTIYRYYE